MSPRDVIAPLCCLLLSAAVGSSLTAQAPVYSYVVPKSVDPLFQNLTIPSDAPAKGMWSTTQNWPLVGLHLTVMPDGRVISFGTPNGQGVQDGRTLDIWDPKQGFVPASHLTLSNGQLVDSFCGTATLLPSGGLLVSGGGSTGDGYTSFASTLVNAAASTAVHSAAKLAAQRWYSTMTTLADGRALITGGGTPYAIVSAYADPTGSAPNISQTPEVYDPAKGWSSLMAANSADAFGPINNRAWYPRQWVAPNGKVFGISTDKMWVLDPAGNGSTQTVGNFKTTVDNTALPNVGPTSTAVMYDTGKVLQAGGNGYNNGYASPSSPYATIVDIAQPASPVLRETAKMNYARQWANSTVLHDGTVVVTGGTTYADNEGDNAVYPAEIWNPSSGKWTIGASAANYRGYHSAVALLADGALLSTGGGVPGPATNFNAEIYYPPYLFTTVNGKAALATRPQLISMSSNNLDYNGTLSIQMDSTQKIADVSLIGLSSVTHSFNTSQRRMKLAFIQNGSQLTVALPSSPNLAPPGYYQIAAVNTNRVPSVGVIVSMHAAAPPQSSRTALLSTDAASHAFSVASQAGYLVRQSNYQVSLARIEPGSSVSDRNDASFFVRPGLADSSCYTFESKTFPGNYLRHYAFQIYLNKSDGSTLFNQDATFCATAGFAGVGFSLRSYNYPTMYLHNRQNSSMGIDANDGSAAFSADATFLQTELSLPVDGKLYSFANVAQSGALIRHANFVGYVSSINGASTAFEISDASFYVRTSAANAACYRFESSNYPGYFLRHQNFALRLDQDDNSTLFGQDSTFCLQSGLAGFGMSLVGMNYPYYVRQNGSQLYLDQNDNSTQFMLDATFTLQPSPTPQ